MIRQFLFNLNNPFLVTAVEECKALAEITMEEANGEELPEKVKLCLECANKMLEGRVVSKEEVKGLLDTVGGYFCSTELYCREYGGEPGQLEHAKELMRFAEVIESRVEPLWGLSLIRGERE